jgi:hypothetical protein
MNEPETEEELSDVDRDALQLALDLTLAGDPADPGRVEQVRHFLHGDGEQHPARSWYETATFAAYHQQMMRLRLRPWQSPPCWVLEREQAEAILEEGPQPACNDPTVDVSDCQTARLTITMLDLGISPFHPDPAKAIAEARRQGHVKPC